MNYYNEFDRDAAQWLRNLIAEGLIPPGDVDDRSIEDVRPADLEGYTQCHFFAGVGGWPEALRLAGVPDDAPLWTGSCPCQPYSAAGAGRGADDPRNLWWALRWLIDQCRPPAVIGEQVASKAGRGWLAGVRADLEALGYAVGSADLCAASAGPEGEGWVVRGNQGGWERIILGAPHIRQRLFWVADASGFRREPCAGDTRLRNPHHGEVATAVEPGAEGASSGLGDSTIATRQRGTGSVSGEEASEHRARFVDGSGDVRPEYAGEGVPDRPTFCEQYSVCASPNQCDGNTCVHAAGAPPGFVWTDSDGWLADAVLGGQQGPGQVGRSGDPAKGADREKHRVVDAGWQRSVAVECSDGKLRRIPESVFQCLADGLPEGVAGLPPDQGFPLAQGVERRTVALKGMGNAIVPQVAAEFITAWRETKCPY